MDDVLRTSEAITRFGTGVVRNKVRRGWWQALCRGVVVLHNGPLTTRQHQLVALASASPRAALGGLTALALEDFHGFTEPRTQIVLPSGARRPSLAGLEVHWSTRLDDHDVHPLRVPRRTRPARSLVDAASWTTNDRHARAIVIAGMQQRLAAIRHLREAILRRGPCRRRALIIESVLDASGGVQSLPERDFGEICRVIGLPAPARQRRIEGPDGRYYLDAGWEQLGMSTEIHGIPHLAVRQWDADLFRANEIVIGGERLLLFSSYAIRHEQRAVGEQLVRMATALGWSGSTDLSALALLEKHRRRKFRRRTG